MLSSRFAPDRRQSQTRFSLQEPSRAFSSDEEETDTEEAERQEEEALSKCHGEATEEATANNKKKPTDAELEQEYAAEEKKQHRQPRPKLTIATLTGVDGLIRIPVDFAHDKRLNNKKSLLLPNNQNIVTAAAAYSQSLIQLYHDWCQNVFPAADSVCDTLATIEKMGSHKQLKDYLEHMRSGVRDKYLEKLFGRQKAEQMLQELDVGLTAASQVVMPEEDEPNNNDNIVASPPMTRLQSNRQDNNKNDDTDEKDGVADDNNEEMEATFDEEEPSTSNKRDTVEQQQPVLQSKRRRLILDDDDDDDSENEMEFPSNNGAHDEMLETQPAEVTANADLIDKEASVESSQGHDDVMAETQPPNHVTNVMDTRNQQGEDDVPVDGEETLPLPTLETNDEPAESQDDVALETQRPIDDGVQSAALDFTQTSEVPTIVPTQSQFLPGESNFTDDEEEEHETQ